MKIYSTLQIGVFHTNYCEDFFIHEFIASHQKLIAVLDGCTMGTESVFASILYGKILRNIAKNRYHQEFIIPNTLSLQQTLKSVLQELITETVKSKNQLGLETNELLSTLIVGIIDIKTSAAEFITIGDGLIYKDGIEYEYEQNDKPDYLGYHLSENFEDWYKVQDQKLSISNFTDLSICTDGMYTFKNLKSKANQKTESEIIAYLLSDTQHKEHDNFLDRKIRFLKDQWDHVVMDDLAIIRIINTP